MIRGIKYNLKAICSIILAAGLYLFASNASAQSFGSNGSFSGFGSGSVCKNSCGNSTCQLTTGSNGALENNCPSGTRYDVDPNCIMNQNASSGSCMDTMPVSSIKRVSETNCYRANGAGGNSKPRNHLGTDYSATEGTVITAAADGTVVWAKPMGGGGRTIIIEHEKKCQCTAGSQNSGCDSKYITVYMHMKAFKVTGGPVKRGQPIGLVGGSNYSGSTLCDWPNKSGTCKPYGPHLHFEIHSGPWKKGYASLKTSIINPLCDDIQNFCGGCSYDVDKCQNKTGSDEWEKLSDKAAEDKSAASAVGSMAPDAFGADSNTVYSAITGCSLEQFLPTTEECWFCPLFRVLFNTASTIAIKSYTVLADGVAMLVIVGFALWLSLLVLRHISAMEVKDPRKMLKEILGQAFKVLVVVLILKVSFFQVIHLTLEPVFNTGMSFAQTITGKGTYNSSNPDQQLSCPASASYMQNINGYDSSAGMTASSTGGLPASMGKNIVCTIKSIQDSVGKMMAYGRQAMCVAWGPKAFIKNFIPSFAYLITGIVIYLGGLLLLVAFPWCLIDCILQMSIAAGLAPAAIGAWAFKITSQYLKTIWNFFMNAMFNFVFLSIIIYIIMTVVDQFMRALNERAGQTTGFDFLVDPIDGLAYWGVTGMKLVVVCLMGWVFLDEGKNFADSFAKGAKFGGDGIGRSVGGAFAQAATKIGKTAAEAGESIGEAGMEMGDYFIGSRIRKARNNYRINKVKTEGEAITDDNGDIIGYQRTRRNLFGKKVTRSVSIDADGKELWSKEKQDLSDELRNKAKDMANQYRLNKLQSEGNEILDDDGNVIGYEQEHRNLLGQKVRVTATKDANGQMTLNKEKRSLRMEALAKLSKEGTRLNQFAKQNAMFKDKSLSQNIQTSTKISSDHLMSVREVKDSTGNVIQRDIAFNTKSVKHLVNRDGTLNMDMVNQIKSGSHFSEETVNEALAKEVLKARGIAMNNKFDARQVRFDDKGVMHINQTNLDGSVTELKMVIGGANGNQMLTEIKTTQKDGSYKINKDNGIMKTDVVYEHGQPAAIASYGFSDEYYRRHKYNKPINRNGEFAIGMDAEAAMFGFNNDDRDRHANQVRTGKAQSYVSTDEFLGDSKKS